MFDLMLTTIWILTIYRILMMNQNIFDKIYLVSLSFNFMYLISKLLHFILDPNNWID